METGEIEMRGGSISHGLEETREITQESVVAVEKGRTSHVVIDIQELEKIRENGTELRRTSPAVCIFEVPACLKNMKRDVYVPQVVGLGPFHHHHTLPHLKEAKEEAVLRTLLKIYPDDSLAIGMENLRNEVMGMKEKIENYYEMSFNFEPDIFILDSCFLLQFLFPKQQIFDYPRGYNWEDRNTASHFEISRDLMKLENQIPLILLQRLIDLRGLPGDIMDLQGLLGMAKRLFFDIDVGNPPFRQTALGPRHLLEYKQQFFSSFAREAEARPDDTQKEGPHCWCGSRDAEALPDDTQKEGPHCWCGSRDAEALPDDTQKEGPHCWCGSREEEGPQSENDDRMWSFPSAHQLEKAGIELKRGPRLSFERKWCGLKGVLTIPRLIIADESEVEIKNMIAFEECLPQHDRWVTCFMSFLDCLIDKDTDVEILRRANIIDNLIQCDQAIADLVNTSSVNVSEAPDLRDLKDKMKAYYRSSCRVMIKEFMDTHVAKPWLLVGTLAAIALLGLTITQTIYAVKSYKPGK